VICEKPLVINPWNLDALESLERETGRRVFTVLQLRLHPRLTELRERLLADPSRQHEVELTYVTARGPWYDVSWKASPEKSGGIPTNIGIHLFDLVLWLFGRVRDCRVHIAQPRRFAGVLHLDRARVRWFLSTESSDLGLTAAAPIARRTFRSIRVDGEEVDFSDSSADLHARVYQKLLSGHGFRIPDARPSIEVAHKIRTSAIAPRDEEAHAIAGQLGGGR
jgi:UDP-N-acetyl-2-amino-2-deoxyglucuronate dehydrogenase